MLTSRKANIVAVLALTIGSGNVRAQLTPPGTPGVADFTIRWSASQASHEIYVGISEGPPPAYGETRHDYFAYWIGVADVDIDSEVGQVISFSSSGTQRIEDHNVSQWECSPTYTAATTYHESYLVSLVPPNPLFIEGPLYPVSLFVTSWPDGSRTIGSPFSCDWSQLWCPIEWDSTFSSSHTPTGADCSGVVAGSYSTSSASHWTAMGWPGLTGEIPAVHARLFRKTYSRTEPNPYGWFRDTGTLEIEWIAGIARISASVDRNTTNPTITGNDLTPAKPGVPVKVIVRATRDGAPLAAKPVKLKRRMDYAAGGHHLTHTGVPTLPVLTQTTNALGEATFIVPAGQIAGTLFMTAELEDPLATPDGVVRSSVTPVTIKVADLFAFDDPKWAHNIGSHPSRGNFGRPRLHLFMRDIAGSVDYSLENFPFWRAECGAQLGKLRNNSMSLPWGGLFDINKNFLTPHKTHRAGNDVDISIVNISMRCRNLLRNAIVAAASAGTPVTISFPPPAEADGDPLPESDIVCFDPATDPIIVGKPCHWHVRIQVEDPPPPSPQNLRGRTPVAVHVARTDDGLYSYEYSLKNGSRELLDKMSVEFSGRPQRVRAPEGWVAFPYADGGLLWGAVAAPDENLDRKPTRPNVIRGLTVEVSTAALRPGEAKTGFMFHHRTPPQVAVANIYAYRPLDRLDDATTKLFRSDGLVQRFLTIGPRAKLTTTVPEAAAQVVLTTGELCRLEWIRSCPASTRPFLAALDRFRTETDHAGDAARSIVREFERLRDQNVLDQNAALILELNMEYLVTRAKSASTSQSPK